MKVITNINKLRTKWLIIESLIYSFIIVIVQLTLQTRIYIDTIYSKKNKSSHFSRTFGINEKSKISKRKTSYVSYCFAKKKHVLSIFYIIISINKLRIYTRS